MKFASQERRSVINGRRVHGHCFARETDATIIVDNELTSYASMLERHGEPEYRRLLMVTPIHELIHRDLRLYNEELVTDAAWDIANLACDGATRIW